MEERNKEVLEFLITVLLADYDMMGLIARGAPYEEYGPEARTILRYLESEEYNVALDVLALKIQYIFEIWFSVKPNLVPCIKIAKEINMLL